MRRLLVPTVDDLDAVRTELGLSQRELSERAGCEPSRFNTILHNDIDPRSSTLRAFVEVLNAAAERGEDEQPVTRTGPKPTGSKLAGEPEWREYERVSAMLDNGPVDAVGSDPSPPAAGGDR